MYKSALTKRIIPCLDIKDGRVVKGIKFLGLKDAGDPIEVAKTYNDSFADELVFLDIDASNEGRKTMLDMVRKIAKEVFIPLTVGGGISTLDDIYNLLNAGCDKVSLNSLAISNPKIIKDASSKFGSQCIVIAIDTKRRGDGSLGVFTHGGRNDSKLNLQDWLKTVQDLGAGEILLTSMDTDGTKKGFDLEQLTISLEILKIPLIASGGAGNLHHFLEAFKLGVDATLAASVFHYQQVNILNLKKFLQKNNFEVRI